MRLTIGSVVCPKGNPSLLGVVTQLTVSENVNIAPLTGIASRLPIDEVDVVMEAQVPDFTYGDSVRIDAPWLAGEIFTVVGASSHVITVESHDGLTFNYDRACVNRA